MYPVFPSKYSGHALPPHERLVLEAYTLLRLTIKEKLSEYDKPSHTHKNLDSFLHKMVKLLYTPCIT